MIEKNYSAGGYLRYSYNYGMGGDGREFSREEAKEASASVECGLMQQVDHVLRDQGYNPISVTSNLDCNTCKISSKSIFLYEGATTKDGAVMLYYDVFPRHKVSTKALFLQMNPNKVEELDLLIKNTIKELQKKAVQSLDSK